MFINLLKNKGEMKNQMGKKPSDVIIKEFEKEYFPCKKEWWCVEGYFNTIETKKKWFYKSTLFQGIDKVKKVWKANTMSIFDIDSKKIYFYNTINGNSKLDSKNDSFQIKYDKSFIKGSYPNYKMSFFDLDNNINLNLEYNSIAFPYWVAKKITEGILPWGLGFHL